MTATIPVGAVGPAGRRHDPLDPAQCRRLLASSSVGRLAFTDGALPLVVPLPYTVRDDDLVLVTDPGARLVSALRGSVVAFGVDSWDTATHTGWGVNVVGPTRLVRDPREATELSRLLEPPPEPWLERCYVTIRMGLLRGWRTTADLLSLAGVDT